MMQVTSQHPLAHAYEGVVILGTPRSGTTLLRRLLDAHSELSCPPETGLLRQAAMFLEGEHTADGFSTSVVDALAFAGVARETLVERLREFVVRFLREITMEDGKRIWVEKSALNAFHAESVLAICGPGCRYVYLHRNPFDCIWSMHEYYATAIQVYVDEIHRYVRAHQEPLVAMAHAWAESNRRLMALSDAEPSRFHRIRYEDLVSDPVATLSGLLRFLSLPDESTTLVDSALSQPGRIGFGDAKNYSRTRVDTASLGGGAGRIGPSVMLRLLDIVGPTMEALGYGRPNVATDDPVRARRRYEIGRIVALRNAETRSE